MLYIHTGFKSSLVHATYMRM